MNIRLIVSVKSDAVGLFYPKKKNEFNLKKYIRNAVIMN